jgi:hypothetical protein
MYVCIYVHVNVYVFIETNITYILEKEILLNKICQKSVDNSIQEFS